MRAVVQKVAQASVTGGGRTAEIGPGVCVLVGIANGDSMEEARDLMGQILKLKLYSNDSDNGERKWTRSVHDAAADVLLVPQFTLHARIKSGRPSFHNALPPSEARPMFDEFVKEFADAHVGGRVECGMFGEYMQVSLVNDGPVTILLET